MEQYAHLTTDEIQVVTNVVTNDSTDSLNLLKAFKASLIKAEQYEKLQDLKALEDLYNRNIPFEI